MKTFIILWDRNDYGKIAIKAETEQDARDMFECGNYDEKDLDIKNGGMEVVEISEAD